MYASKFFVAMIPQLQQSHQEVRIYKNTEVESRVLKVQPDWSSCIDFNHHLVPAIDASKVAHLPQSIVLDDVALPKGCASPALSKGLAFCEVMENVIHAWIQNFSVYSNGV